MTTIKIGDCVKVKKGVKDPDFEDLLIEDWQGNVIEVFKKDKQTGDVLIAIQWDSKTLKNYPKKYIEMSIDEDLDWTLMHLSVSNVEITTSRDTPEDIQEMQEELAEENHWVFFGEEGKRIANVLKGTFDEWDAFLAWEDYMRENLKFPFDAILDETEARSVIKIGSKIVIKGILLVDDHYGIIMDGKFNNKTFHFPICDVAVSDINSKNFEVVQDYSVWFANR